MSCPDGLACIFAASDKGNTRFAIQRISAISKVAFLERFVPVVDSSSMDVRACLYMNIYENYGGVIVQTSQRPAFVRIATNSAT